ALSDLHRPGRRHRDAPPPGRRRVRLRRLARAPDRPGRHRGGPARRRPAARPGAGAPGALVPRAPGGADRRHAPGPHLEARPQGGAHPGEHRDDGRRGRPGLRPGQHPRALLPPADGRGDRPLARARGHVLQGRRAAPHRPHPAQRGARPQERRGGHLRVRGDGEGRPDGPGAAGQAPAPRHPRGHRLAGRRAAVQGAGAQGAARGEPEGPRAPVPRGPHRRPGELPPAGLQGPRARQDLPHRRGQGGQRDAGRRVQDRQQGDRPGLDGPRLGLGRRPARQGHPGRDAGEPAQVPLAGDLRRGRDPRDVGPRLDRLQRLARLPADARGGRRGPLPAGPRRRPDLHRL
ncbi:MAG: hypothetical protein AVDCRST_MAG13-122, partial [uncultured Solirubrobacteraceae bacterium]